MTSPVAHPAARTTTTDAALWRTARRAGLPVALWQLPGQQQRHAIVDLSGRARRTTIDLESLPAGFAFSPFDNPDGQQSHFLRADLHFTWEATSGHYARRADPLQDPSPAAEAFLAQLRRCPPAPPAGNVEHFFAPHSSDTDRQAYQQLVAAGGEAIRRGDFHKVVLSRRRAVALPPDFDVLRTFDRLCTRYAHAFVSLVWLPGVGTWVGASPETLISVDAAGIFRTVALAGTQALRPEVPITQVQWTQKEIEEQALVTRYIIECFKKIRLREYQEVGPKTVVAGNLMHLRTDFSVDTHAVRFAQLGTVMLQLLHPTSAVCGTPKEPALAFIRQHEGYDRQFYSGFLGPVNVGEASAPGSPVADALASLLASHLFVNLRCMQVPDEQPDAARQGWLYAGAGITADSRPEREWLETEMKCQTMGFSL